MQNDSRDRISEWYVAYLEGHFQFLIDEVAHDEIEFFSNAPAKIVPYLVHGKGKAALLSAWKAARADYEFLNYTPLLVATDGAGAAAVVVQMRAKIRATNRPINLMLADFMQFKDGRVIELRQFMDAIEAEQQWLGQEINVSKS